MTHDLSSSPAGQAGGPPSARRTAPRGRRPAGPYLQRRGRIYYFRKRCPKVIREKGARNFLCFSLKTEIRVEAMRRATRLLAVINGIEDKVMNDNFEPALTPENGGEKVGHGSGGVSLLRAA
ncbi:DUF6538 domain-containing protein [Limimaricola litoreus]|uniref:DUF6538 domain-containing protein n=1 Tax=Limimaricola litoreus TaxID=2955316 RepID=A0A9X2FV40_9RHOB|nr:DUF6538 domain-containing protein [Limimaricola litoreus]MCP1169026.1 hypothetical protein [Limimaricola litoreus]